MKKIIIIILVLFCLKSFGQSPIVDLHTSTFDGAENTYYQDIEGFYDQFVGTWKYTDATQTIRLKFIKKQKFYSKYSKNYYVDYLVGEAQYIKNGVILLNSLSNLNVNHSDIDKYNIVSTTKIGYNWSPKCVECPLNVERLLMSYDEATNDDWGLSRNLAIRKVIENGVTKLKIQFDFIASRSGMHKDDLDSPSTTLDFTVPFGNYTLTKEP